MTVQQPAVGPRTIIDKIWDGHHVVDLDPEVSLIHIDRTMLHDRSGGSILRSMRENGRRIAHPQRVFGTYDHVVDTIPGRGETTMMPGGEEFIALFKSESEHARIQTFTVNDPRQGIVHVIAPELGIALPGLTLACGDSHTPTLGGIGALGFAVGNTQAEHVLSTGTLALKRPRRMRVQFEGKLPAGTSAKDMALALIGRYSTAGAAGYVVEFSGAAVRALPSSGRMTLCNMAPEFSAISAIVSPDDAVYNMLYGKQYAPPEHLWEAAIAHWRDLATDDDASFDEDISMDVSGLAPQVTWGTSPEHVTGVDGVVPDPYASGTEPRRRDAMERALSYAGLQPGTPLSSVSIGAAFIGSCTNNRIDDLRAAARILDGRRVADGIKAICVPGSTSTKAQAEAEGLDKVFKNAGFEWREAGCSLCVFTNGDNFGDAERVISSTNRNFENRQGPNVKTHLASPETVAASAILGKIAYPRKLG